MMWRHYRMVNIDVEKISGLKSKSLNSTYWWEVPRQILYASCPMSLGTKDLQVGLLWYSPTSDRWAISSLILPDAFLPIWLQTSKLLTISAASSLTKMVIRRQLTTGVPSGSNLLQTIRNSPIIILDDSRICLSFQWYLRLIEAINSTLPLLTLTEQWDGFMPDIFKAGAVGADSRAIDEIHHYIIASDRGKGVSETIIINFARGLIPIHSVGRVIQVLSDAGLIRAIGMDKLGVKYYKPIFGKPDLKVVSEREEGQQ